MFLGGIEMEHRRLKMNKLTINRLLEKELALAIT